MVQALLARGASVTVIDDCSRGHRGAIDRIRDSHAAAGNKIDLAFEICSIHERERVAAILVERRIESVIHFAALAYVGESVERPLDYWRTNLGGTIALLEAIDSSTVSRLVFSSTCSTYGIPDPTQIPIAETCPQQPVNPYGAAKLAAERAITDYQIARAASGRPLACAILRYFNIIGCDPSGVLGEDHTPETHIVPSCLAATLGLREPLQVMGTDYATADGTCVRDYVDVVDLCAAHSLALAALVPGVLDVFNVGTGRGHSVREVLAACARVTGKAVPHVEGERRAGDPPVLVADSSKIRRERKWSASREGIDASIAAAWAWMRANPRGYR